jgi:hypothetical protein
MVNLRALAELDLKTTLESEFKLPVFLTGPDGIDYSTNTDGQPLSGQIIYETIEFDATGAGIKSPNPVVTLRRSSLVRIPVNSEVWEIRIPITPDLDGTLKTFLTGPAAPEGGDSIGYIKLFLREVEQSV